MSTPAEPGEPDVTGTIEERLAAVYAALVYRLQRASDAAQLGERGYADTWRTFARATLDWLGIEREVLFPAIDRALAFGPERRLLVSDHVQLRRLLEEATVAIDSDGPDALAEAVQETLFALYRHGVRARRRFAVQLDRMLPPTARRQLLSQLPPPRPVRRMPR
jgi:hypothetical protein